MSITPVCGYLNAVQARAEEIFRDGMMKNDYIAHVGAGQALLEQQQGVTSFPSITGTKNKEVRVEWNTDCVVTTTACTDDCTITGDDIQPVCTDYELHCLRETTFQVPERLYRDKNIERTEAIAKKMILHKNAMDVWLTQYIIAQLVLNAGTNAFTGGGMTVAGTTTFVPPALWDDSIWGYFNQVVLLNDLRQPYLITGNNLYQLLFNRPLESANAQGGAANVRKINTLKVYQDPFNVETVAAGQSILVHRGAAAMITKAWYPSGAINAVNPEANIYIWSERSENLPGIEYDIFMQKTCSGNEFYEAYKIQLHGFFALNPLPCNDRTGVLLFECGNAPAA